MALGGIGLGLANLGAIAGGLQQYQQRDVEIQRALAQLATEQRRQRLFDQQQQAQAGFFRAGMDPATANLFGTPQTGAPGAVPGPDYSPGAIQATPLAPPAQPMQIPLAPSYGPSGGMPTDAQLNLAREAIARGYPPAAAAGMAGSLVGESGRNLDPYALNPRSGALGKAQWLGSRKTGLLSQPDPYSDATQDRYLFGELRGPEAATGQQMMGETDPRQAARDFTIGFERPGLGSTAAREDAAARIYDQLDGAQQNQARRGAINAATAIPPQFAGRLNLPQLAQIVNRTSPGASDEVKGAILGQLLDVATPLAKMQFEQGWEQYKFAEQQTEKKSEFAEQQTEKKSEFAEQQAEKKSEFKIREEEIKAQHAFNRELAAQRLAQGEQAGGSMYQPTDPEGKPTGPPLWVAKGQASPISGLPEGAGGGFKVGTRPQGGVQLTDAQADFWAKVLQGGGALPPGMARTGAIGKIAQRLGDTGSPEDFVANRSVVKADTASLQSLTRMRDAIVSYERTAIRNFDLALQKVKDVPMSDWGPWLNKWAREGSTTFGGQAMPAYATALVTAANEYAKILSGSTGAQAATDSSRRETAELISQYFSAGQVEAVIDVAKQEMHNREIELNSQISNIEGAIKARVSGGGSAGSTAPAPRLRYNPDTGRLE